MNDLSLVLYWTVETTLAFLIVAPGLSATLAWFAAALLVAGPIWLASAPDTASWIVCPFTILIALPIALGAAIERTAAIERYGLAQGLALARFALHPSGANLAVARFCRAMMFRQRGLEQRAVVGLQRVAGQASEIGLLARVLVCRSRGQYEGLLGDPRLGSDNGGLRLRLLAYTGRVEAMIDVYRSLLTRHPALALGHEVQRARTVLAYGGRPGGIASLHRGPLSNAKAEVKAGEIACARLAEGGADHDAALTVLRAQAVGEDLLQARRADILLNDPPMSVSALGPEHRAFLDRLEAAVAALPPRSGFWKATVTLALVAINLTTFFAEIIAGGSTDGETLYKLGALPLGHFDAADSWRFVTAMFLHAGPIHVGANMLVLLLLGPQLERMVGRWRFLSLYIGAGLMANIGSVWLGSLNMVPHSLLVGASGAIMGLVGAAAGSATRHWVVTRSPVFARRLLGLTAAIGLQAAIDTTIAQVSGSTHLFGAAAGFLFGVFLRFDWPTPASAFADSIEPASPTLRYAGAAGRSSPWRRLAPLLSAGCLAASIVILHAFG